MHLGLSTSTALLSFSLIVFAADIKAHEYWLDAIDSSVARGKAAIVNVRNGQNFAGVSFPYDGSKYTSVLVSGPSSQSSYKGRLGDYPALHPTLTENGLHSISLETTAQLLVYKSWQQFSTFVAYHGLDEIIEQHLQRNLPKADIRERYFRSAKTIIQVSDNGVPVIGVSKSEGISKHKAFSPVGSTFEMILLDNPYSDTKVVRAQLLFKGVPLAGRQAELFWKGSHELRLTTTTDMEGIASFKILGAGDYMLNAVNVTEPKQDDVHWVSHWASISFER